MVHVFLKYGYKQKTLSILSRKTMTGKYILQVWIFLFSGRGIEINLAWFTLLTTINFIFSEKFLNFEFNQISSSPCCLYGTTMMRLETSDKTGAQNPLNLRQKPNCFGHTGLYSQNEPVSILKSRDS